MTSAPGLVGTLDSDANGFAQISNISLSANDPDEDMGIFVSGSLGDSVVCVSTGDPLANITVTLFEDFDGDGLADGTAIASTETDAAGFYLFSGLQVALAGDPKRFVFQGVHMLFDGQPGREWEPGAMPVNQLIFIGRNLDREELQAGLSSCLA